MGTDSEPGFGISNPVTVCRFRAMFESAQNQRPALATSFEIFRTSDSVELLTEADDLAAWFDAKRDDRL
jgi:hypothetical protein